MLIAMSMDTGMAAKSRWDDERGPETMRVEWNPVMAGLQEAAADVAGRMARRHAMPTGMAEMDVEAFLRRMSAARC